MNKNIKGWNEMQGDAEAIARTHRFEHGGQPNTSKAVRLALAVCHRLIDMDSAVYHRVVAEIMAVPQSVAKDGSDEQ